MRVEMSHFQTSGGVAASGFSYALIAVVLGIIGCFVTVKPIVQLLEIPAQGVKFLQLQENTFLFSIKVAEAGGLLAIASPFINFTDYSVRFTGLTRRRLAV